eukprot:3539995-Rhodomonas_salina.2
MTIGAAEYWMEYLTNQNLKLNVGEGGGQRAVQERPLEGRLGGAREADTMMEGGGRAEVGRGDRGRGEGGAADRETARGARAEIRRVDPGVGERSGEWRGDGMRVTRRAEE